MIAVYIPSWNALSIKVLLACRPDSYKGTLMILQSVGDLRRRLIQGTQDLIVLILVVDNHERLKSLTFILEYLIDIKTILVLPKNEVETLSLGYTFFPNYITIAEGSFDDLTKVVNEMVGRSLM